MNPTWNFRADDRLLIDGTAYSFVSQSSDGVTLDSIEKRGLYDSFSFVELSELFRSSRLRYDRGYFARDRADRRRRFGDLLLSNLKENIRSRTLWKVKWCEKFLELEADKKVVRTQASVEEAIPTIKATIDAEREKCQLAGKRGQAGMEIRLYRSPSWRSILKWVRRYVRAGLSALALAPMNAKGVPPSTRFDPESEKFLTRCIEDYASPRRPTKIAIARRTIRRFTVENEKRVAAGLAPLTVPSIRTITRRISRLDPYFTCIRREGIDVANRKFALFEKGVEARYPLERVEIDEWEVDLITLLTTSDAIDALSPTQLAKIERGRRILCVAIDCATRCVVGMRLGATASGSLARATLSDIGIDKSEIAASAGAESSWAMCGGVGTIVADQGPAFVSDVFQSAVLDSGVNLEHPPAGAPMLRGRIERLFRTFTTELMGLLSGRTFSNPVEKGDYPAEREAVLTDDLLYEILVQFVVDVYHNQPHSGLDGETPANCWKRLSKKYGVSPPPCGFTRRAIFGSEFRAKVTGRGVQWFGIDYACTQLHHHFLHSPDRKVAIRLDPEDLGWATVRIGDVWYAAPALQRTFDGVALDDWKIVCRKLREKRAGEAALVEDTVHEALASISEKDRLARKRMRLVSPKMSAAQLEALNCDLYVGLTINVTEQSSPESQIEATDLLGHVVEAEDPPISASKSSEMKSSRRPPKKRWRIQDDE